MGKFIIEPTRVDLLIILVLTRNYLQQDSHIELKSIVSTEFVIKIVKNYYYKLQDN